MKHGTAAGKEMRETASARPKRVWIVCQHAGAPRYGMNYRPYNLGRELVAMGVDVTVIGSPYSHQFFAQPRIDGIFTIENIDGMRYCWIKTAQYPESQSNARVRAWWDFARRLSLLARRAGSLGIPEPDAILVSSPPPYAILPAALLARRYSARLVFEARDLWPLSLIGLGGHSPWHPFIAFTQWVEDFAYRRSDTVVSVPPAAEPYMRSRGLAPGKFHHIPNGVNIDRESNDLADFSAGIVRLALPGRSFIVGYAGTVGLANALGAFVGAAAILRDHREIGFALIGDGAEIPSLKTQAAALGLDNIAFIPAVPKTRIPSILAELDVCYLGLKREKVFLYGVSPTKLFDYLLAAKPVIMAIDSANDLIAAAKCGFTVEPENPAAIADAVLALAATTPERRRAMGESGRNYVIAHHEWSALGKKYAEILGLEP